MMACCTVTWQPTLRQSYIAIENGRFEDVFPIELGDSIAMLVYQTVSQKTFQKDGQGISTDLIYRNVTKQRSQQISFDISD